MKKSIRMIIVLLLTAVLLSLSGCGTGGGYGGYSTSPNIYYGYGYPYYYYDDDDCCYHPPHDQPQNPDEPVRPRPAMNMGRPSGMRMSRPTRSFRGRR